MDKTCLNRVTVQVLNSDLKIDTKASFVLFCIMLMSFYKSTMQYQNICYNHNQAKSLHGL